MESHLNHSYVSPIMEDIECFVSSLLTFRTDSHNTSDIYLLVHVISHWSEGSAHLMDERDP
jgi:hypothetical protein